MPERPLKLLPNPSLANCTPASASTNRQGGRWAMRQLRPTPGPSGDDRPVRYSTRLLMWGSGSGPGVIVGDGVGGIPGLPGRRAADEPVNHRPQTFLAVGVEGSGRRFDVVVDVHVAAAAGSEVAARHPGQANVAASVLAARAGEWDHHCQGASHGLTFDIPGRRTLLDRYRRKDYCIGIETPRRDTYKKWS
jgi:hypothetical protein